MKMLWIAAAAAAGYVLGAKAGRERYEQIVALARDLRGNPAVAETLDAAAAVVQRGKDAVTEKVTDAAAKVKDAVQDNPSSTA
jgi:hypothetical protein